MAKIHLRSYVHCGVKQLRIGKSIGILQSSVWNCVKYVNLEGSHRDSHIHLNYVGVASYNSEYEQFYF